LNFKILIFRAKTVIVNRTAASLPVASAHSRGEPLDLSREEPQDLSREEPLQD